MTQRGKGLQSKQATTTVEWSLALIFLVKVAVRWWEGLHTITSEWLSTDQKLLCWCNFMSDDSLMHFLPDSLIWEWMLYACTNKEKWLWHGFSSPHLPYQTGPKKEARRYCWWWIHSLLTHFSRVFLLKSLKSTKGFLYRSCLHTVTVPLFFSTLNSSYPKLFHMFNTVRYGVPGEPQTGRASLTQS